MIWIDPKNVYRSQEQFDPFLDQTNQGTKKSLALWINKDPFTFITEATSENLHVFMRMFPKIVVPPNHPS